MNRATTTNYAFIDAQNLNLGIRELGWDLDFRRFRVYLKEKYQVSKAYLFIGYVPENTSLYKSLQEFGYTLMCKPILKKSAREKINFLDNLRKKLGYTRKGTAKGRNPK